MRRKISLLVAATTSAVIIAFLIPLAMLVRTLAEDRAVAGASQEAQGVATLVAGVTEPPPALPAQVTVVPETGLLLASVTLTTNGRVRLVAIRAVWESPVTLAIAAGGGVTVSLPQAARVAESASAEMMISFFMSCSFVVHASGGCVGHSFRRGGACGASYWQVRAG